MRPVSSEKLRTINRYGFYPVMLVVSMFAYFSLSKGRSLEEISAISACIAFVNIACVHLFERLFPYRADWNVSQGDRLSNFIFTNLVLPGTSKVIELSLGFLFLNLTGDLVRNHIHSLWPSSWSPVAQLTLSLVICEFFFYWIHRWGHTTEFLWRFHSIHHAVKRVYWDNAGRFHPVDMVLNLAFYMAPLFVLGAPPEIVGAFLTINAVTGLLEHANVDFEAGPLNYVFNSAQLHRWHHSTEPEESAKNFGKVLVIWDILFGTWFLPKDRDVRETGVTTEAIPEDVLGQMLHPFRTMKIAASKIALILLIGLMGVLFTFSFRAAAAESPPQSPPHSQAPSFDRCIALGPHESLFLSASQFDPYGRDVLLSRQLLSCETVNSFGRPLGPWVKARASQLERLPPEAKQIVEQLQAGATEPWPGTARDYLQKNPIANFDGELNKTLTEKYGMSYAARVFREWVISDPRNREALETVLRSTHNPSRSEPNEQIRIFVNMGLGWDDKLESNTLSYTHDFVKTMKALGYPVVFAQRDNYGSIEANAQAIATQLQREFKKPGDVIVLSLCKGAPETIRALALVSSRNEKGEISEQLPGGGRLRAIVHLSGMMTGTYFSDTFGSSKGIDFLGRLVSRVPNLTWAENGKTLAALDTMTTEKVEAAVRGFKIPPSIRAISVTGAALTRAQFPEESPLAPFAKLNRSLQILPQSNDGFMPLQGTLFPRDMAPHSKALVFDASHLLADGSFEGIDLRNAEARNAVYRAIIDFAAGE